MCCKGFIKRILPFFLTFSLGLLIASFFVTVAVPNFSNFKRRGFNRHREYDRKMEFENQQLRSEKNRLQQRVNELENQNLSEDLDVPAPPLPPKMKKLVLKEEVRTVKVQ